MWERLLSLDERHTLNRLRNGNEIQNYLNALPMNFEEKGDTLMSPRGVLAARHAHCMEGALFAAAALWYHGEPPLLLDLRALPEDDDHVVALFRKGKYWGAISKTNHAVLRYRDPIYRSVRELAMSYFHEYFLNTNGKKTLVDYSRPFSLKRYGKAWIVAKEPLDDIAEDLDQSPHTSFFPRGALLRPADAVERKAGSIVEWKGKRHMV